MSTMNVSRPRNDVTIVNQIQHHSRSVFPPSPYKGRHFKHFGLGTSGIKLSYGKRNLIILRNYRAFEAPKLGEIIAGTLMRFLLVSNMARAQSSYRPFSCGKEFLRRSMYALFQRKRNKTILHFLTAVSFAGSEWFQQ